MAPLQLLDMAAQSLTPKMATTFCHARATQPIMFILFGGHPRGKVLPMGWMAPLLDPGDPSAIVRSHD